MKKIFMFLISYFLISCVSNIKDDASSDSMIDIKLNFDLETPAEKSINGPVKYLEYDHEFLDLEFYRFWYDKKRRITKKVLTDIEHSNINRRVEIYHYHNGFKHPFKIEDNDGSFRTFKWDGFGNMTYSNMYNKNGLLINESRPYLSKISSSDGVLYQRRLSSIDGNVLWKGDFVAHYNKYGDLINTIFHNSTEMVIDNKKLIFRGTNKPSVTEYKLFYFTKNKIRRYEIFRKGSLQEYVEFYDSIMPQKKLHWDKNSNINGGLFLWKNYITDDYDNWISRDKCEVINNDLMRPENCIRETRLIMYYL